MSLNDNESGEMAISAVLARTSQRDTVTDDLQPDWFRHSNLRCIRCGSPNAVQTVDVDAGRAEPSCCLACVRESLRQGLARPPEWQRATRF